MNQARQTLSRWMAGRKFALLIAYWAFIFIGAAILYLVNASEFEDCMMVYNSALEWALWGFVTFAGIEGGKEVMDIVRGTKKPVSQPNNYPGGTTTEIV